jgi:hypothetical protein
MKKTAFFLFSLIALLSVKAQTADEVINKFIEANGGKERLNAISSIQVQSSLTLQQLGMNISITTIKEKNKLFRIQSSSPMGDGESYTVINDTAGFFYMPAMNSPMGSTEASFTRFTTEEFTNQAYQKDCAGYFAQLIDYATKGSTTTLDGTDKVNDVECDKVKLKLKTGQEMTYYIAKTNGQVKRLKLSMAAAMEMMGLTGMLKMMGSSRGERKIDMDFEKYKIFDGFPFPTKQTIQLGLGPVVVENTSFKVSQPVDAKWYKVQ